MKTPQETVDFYVAYLLEKHSAAIAKGVVSGQGVKVWVDDDDNVIVGPIRDPREVSE